MDIFEDRDGDSRTTKELRRAAKHYAQRAKTASDDLTSAASVRVKDTRIVDVAAEADSKFAFAVLALSQKVDIIVARIGK